MKVLVRQENFSTVRYELHTGDTELECAGKDRAFSLPYRELKDFCIIQDGKGKTYFTMLAAGRMYEGRIPYPQEIGLFVTELKAKLGGVIRIEVRKK